jgi:predicted dienelactone hydrolase
MPPPEPMTSPGVYRDTRVTAIVELDPAAGPGHDAASLANVRMPVLIVGTEDNDFLPFTRHECHYAALLPNAALVTLRNGEGHFVYLNSCTSDLSANGVPLCRDRQGVDREAVHADLAARILAFFLAVM